MGAPIAATNSAVIAMAAIHARRLEEVADAFRVAGATAADRARDPAELGLTEHERQIEEYRESNILRAGTHAGTLYFDEQGYIDHRERGKKKAGVSALISLAIILVIIGISLAVVVARR